MIAKLYHDIRIGIGCLTNIGTYLSNIYTLPKSVESHQCPQKAVHLWNFSAAPLYVCLIRWHAGRRWWPSAHSSARLDTAVTNTAPGTLRFRVCHARRIYVRGVCALGVDYFGFRTPELHTLASALITPNLNEIRLKLSKIFVLSMIIGPKTDGIHL